MESKKLEKIRDYLAQELKDEKFMAVISLKVAEKENGDYQLESVQINNLVVKEDPFALVNGLLQATGNLLSSIQQRFYQITPTQKKDNKVLENKGVTTHMYG